MAAKWIQDTERHYKKEYNLTTEAHITVTKKHKFHPYILKNKNEIIEDYILFNTLQAAQKHCNELVYGNKMPAYEMMNLFKF